ncbi:hypothetical protein [Candidatus Tisiphia endosymbiont of Ceraclea dissimilis]|uniref:hypothetical protein n=1 Tax=Candidatus Tisiphia endosymbiont of Ceraclea dissimilis TaxID=3077928 RepID=UPI003CCA949A
MTIYPSNDPYKMQVAEYRIGGEVTGLILRTIKDNIQKATDQLPKTKALITTPFACAGEILGYVVNPVVSYLDPKGKIRQAIDNIPDEGTKTLLGITGGAALGVGVGLAVKGAVDTAKKVVLKAAGIEAVGGVGSALTATEGAAILGKGAVVGEVAGIGENTLVGDLGLVEVGEVKLGTSNVASDLSLQKHIETVTGIKKPLDLKLEQYTTSLKQYENWTQLSDLTKKVPEEFGLPIYNRKDIGLRWQMQDKEGMHNIRIDKADLFAKHSTQQVDHVIVSYNGKVIDYTGKNYIIKDEATGAIYKIERSKFDSGTRSIEHGFDINTQVKKTTKHPDAHIPADMWVKWKSFHKPN